MPKMCLANTMKQSSQCLSIFLNPELWNKLLIQSTSNKRHLWKHNFHCMQHKSDIGILWVIVLTHIDITNRVIYRYTQEGKVMRLFHVFRDCMIGFLFHDECLNWNCCHCMDPPQGISMFPCNWGSGFIQQGQCEIKIVLSGQLLFCQDDFFSCPGDVFAVLTR